VLIWVLLSDGFLEEYDDATAGDVRHEGEKPNAC
jgi:hypothetical protein